MKPAGINGVFKDKNKLFTENPESCKGIKVYNERFINFNGKQFRSWNPYRSKLAAAILKNLNFEIKSNYEVLYLGAATGTTVSHISDIIKNGVIFAVENSAIAIKDLIEVSEKRKNIIPILEDANHPDRYNSIVCTVDMIYQDISQRNQSEIFIKNAKRYLKKEGQGLLMVKARSINVSLKPKEVFKIVSDDLEKSNFKVENVIELLPYEKDHAAILVSL